MRIIVRNGAGGLTGPDFVGIGAEADAEVAGGFGGDAADFAAGGEIDGDDAGTVEDGGEGAGGLNGEVGWAAFYFRFEAPRANLLGGGDEESVVGLFAGGGGRGEDAGQVRSFDGRRGEGGEDEQNGEIAFICRSRLHSVCSL